MFVVDASKSNAMGLDGQLTIIRSVLKNAPTAKAEVVVYRRHATRLFGRFANAIDVDALLK